MLATVGRRAHLETIAASSDKAYAAAREMGLPKTSFAMVQTEPRKLEPMDLPLPQISADSGLLKIEACGICGSDYEQFEGVLRTPMPVVPGHEPRGVIAAIGD